MQQQQQPSLPPNSVDLGLKQEERRPWLKSILTMTLLFDGFTKKLCQPAQFSTPGPALPGRASQPHQDTLAPQLTPLNTTSLEWL
ncbi:hypothetical protein RRG08_000764 [Elysia crispata]|uniref:Uncharacterized protein n=1 Tax=Elysia crispata TaxID=231223 RepID=A0AAE0YKY2_9GAST|nr:hypothetical protein RRG08_000764 [Elysia crispata]